jgi:hypothetical protein
MFAHGVSFLKVGAGKKRRKKTPPLDGGSMAIKKHPLGALFRFVVWAIRAVIEYVGWNIVIVHGTVMIWRVCIVHNDFVIEILSKLVIFFSVYLAVLTRCHF